MKLPMKINRQLNRSGLGKQKRQRDWDNVRHSAAACAIQNHVQA